MRAWIWSSHAQLLAAFLCLCHYKLEMSPWSWELDLFSSYLTEGEKKQMLKTILRAIACLFLVFSGLFSLMNSTQRRKLIVTRAERRRQAVQVVVCNLANHVTQPGLTFNPCAVSLPPANSCLLKSRPTQPPQPWRSTLRLHLIFPPTNTVPLFIASSV